MLGRLLREPLVQFGLLGLALFGVFRLAGPGAADVDANRIVVSSARIEQLATLFAKTWQRPPTESEMKGLVDDWVLEEIYYRRALEMGIDRNDAVIRRRLRQKVEFFTDDAASMLEPTEEELASYLADHPEDFRLDPTFTLRQLYFDPARHGEDPVGYVEDRLRDLKEGGPIDGDTTLLPERFEEATPGSLDQTLGPGFADQLDGVPEGEWSGPFGSSYGLHLVRIETRTEGRLPELDEIRDDVSREWVHSRRLEMKEKLNARMLEDYDVIVEWPAGDA